MSRRKPYVRPMQGWWRRNPNFTRYMLREGTSMFLALYACILLIGVITLANGPDAYAAWLAAVHHPISVLVHLVVLAAAIYHSITWFAVSPKAMPPLRVGGDQVPPNIIIASQYAAAAVASLVVLAVAIGG